MIKKNPRRASLGPDRTLDNHHYRKLSSALELSGEEAKSGVEWDPSSCRSHWCTLAKSMIDMN